MTKIKKLTIAITTAILAVAITASILVACSSNNSDGSKTDKESATATESVTEKATEKPTEKETEKSSEKATEKSTEKSTATETENSTEKSTEKTNNKENKNTDTNTENSEQITYYTTTVDNNDQNSNNNNSSSDNSSAGDNSSQSSNNNSNNNSSTNTKTWHEAEYKTVHHEAETKKVWVVDQEAQTYEEPVYEEQPLTICYTCGAEITGNTSNHGKSHMLSGENFSYGVEYRNVQTGTKIVTVEEKGHWETQVIKEAWTEQVLVREAGYY